MYEIMKYRIIWSFFFFLLQGTPHTMPLAQLGYIEKQMVKLKPKTRLQIHEMETWYVNFTWNCLWHLVEFKILSYFCILYNNIPVTSYLYTASFMGFFRFYDDFQSWRGFQCDNSDLLVPLSHLCAFFSSSFEPTYKWEFIVFSLNIILMNTI